jgi:ABC-2 type transport system permease protein
MTGFRLYLRYAAVSLRAQMLYPAAFLMVTVAQFLIITGVLGAMWALFDRFGEVRGWGFPDVALFFALANLTFALADTVNRGFEALGPEMIKTGDFDRLLVRPRSLALQVLGYELRLTRLGRMFQGFFALAIAVAAMPPLGVDDILVLLFALAGGTALFSALLILQATLSFWTIESLEVANTLTYGGVEASRFPLDIYQPWFARFLIGIIPLGCVIYYPALYVLDRPDPFGAPAWFLPLAPLTGFIFLAVSLFVWTFGVRRYRSTGS